MTSSHKFSITHTYSEIVGFQKKSEDSYEAMIEGENIIAEYICKTDDLEKHEKICVTGMPFELFENIVLYISENAVRGNAWIDVVSDYCYEYDAKIKIIL